MSSPLAARYSGLALPLDVPGDWEVLVEPWAPTSLFTISRLIDAPPILDRQVRAAGDVHLQRLRERGANLFDGPVLAMANARPGLLTLRPGSYLDHVRCATVLSDEWQSRTADDLTPLRDRLDHYADDDPLHNGAGRCAALAVCTLLVWSSPQGAEFVLGQRSQRVVIGPGLWHVVPAGMVEPGGNALADTLAHELAEEIALEAGEAERALAGVSVLGLVFNLERLQTEVACLIVVGGARPRIDDEEHESARWWPYTETGLQAALEELGSAQLMPSAAGTIELASWRLRTRR